MIRVLLVDRQTEVRKGLRMCLAIEPDIAVVGETGKIEEAHRLAQALGPAVIMVDVGRQGIG
jgi:DNA-binding NarL/FixJ family response regulator